MNLLHKSISIRLQHIFSCKQLQQFFYQFCVQSFMPPKYYRPKGTNKPKAANSPVISPNRITQAFREDQSEEKMYFYWWDCEEHYNYTTGPEIMDFTQPSLPNILIEPVMILANREMKKIPQIIRPQPQMTKEKDLDYLGVYQPLETQGCIRELQKVKEPLEFPYSSIGMITFMYKQDIFFSTGVIVGDNLILTAAENCYSIDKKQEHLYISFTPSFEGSSGFTLKAKNIFIPPEYKNLQDPDRLLYNFCFIQLATEISLSKYFGCLPMRLQNQDGNKLPNYSKPAKLCGFTLDEDGLPQLMQASIDITDNFDVICYKFGNPGRKGLAGSPIISEDMQIIGIHNYTSGKQQRTSCGLATMSWIMYDFVQSLPKKSLKTYRSSYKHYRMDDSQAIAKLYLYQNYYQRGYENHQKSQKVRSSFVNQSWPNLRTLSIEDIFDAESCKLISQARFYNLTKLKLNGNRIGDQGCRWLADGNWNLVQLHIANNQIRGQGIDWLIGAGWKNLREFDFVGNQLAGEYQRWIPRSEWPKLHLLSISANQQNKLEDSHSKEISNLHIHRGNCILERWDKWLLTNNWKKLSVINFDESKVGNKGCKWIHQGCFSLKELQMSRNNISDEGIKWLVKSNWKDVTLIQLQFNHLTNQSCAYLAQAKWPSLLYLNLQNNLIRRSGLKRLMKCSFQLSLNIRMYRMYFNRYNWRSDFPF